MISVKIQSSNKCAEANSAFLSFPYNPAIINIVKSLPGRWWHADTKQWEIPFSTISTFISKLDGTQEVDISGKYVAVEKQDTTIPASFSYKTTPFKHQTESMQYALTHDRFLLADEQGLGKTKQVIDIAVVKKLQHNYKHCLIVCGVNGLKWNWLNEIHTHSNEEGYILGQQYNSKGNLVIGSSKDKLNDAKSLNKISAYFIITNVESLRNAEIADALAEACNNGEINIVAIDEIHKCKNASSQQGKGILKLQPNIRIAMTGTPLMNRPFDLYIILKWLGYERYSFYTFTHHYGVYGGYQGYELIRYQHLDQLQANLNKIMLRRLKKDVLDLPEKLYIDEYVEMDDAQTSIYNEVSSEVLANIDKIKMSPNPLASLIRLRQATGYTGILSTNVKVSAKLDRMKELVEETVDNDKKVVIFSNWSEITAIVRTMLKDYNPAYITGDTKDNERQQEVDHFQNDPNCKVIIGTTGAMGTGITLTAGTVEVFLDEPWNRALKDQAVDRCHRVGTKENVTIYTLLTKNTIDEKIHQLINEKGEMSDMIVDNDTMSNNKLVDFLLS